MVSGLFFISRRRKASLTCPCGAGWGAVRKLKISKSQLPTGFTCPSFGSIKFESLYASVDDRSSNQRARLLPGWAAVRKLRVLHRALLRGNASQRSLAYVNAGAQYMRQVSGILKDKVNSLRSNSLNSLEGPQGSTYLSPLLPLWLFAIYWHCWEISPACTSYYLVPRVVSTSFSNCSQRDFLVS